MSYCGVDVVVRLLTKFESGTLMAKIYIKSAYRLVPVRPADWSLLGYQLEGQYYFDQVLPFGLGSAPFLFCQFFDTVRWIVRDATGLHSELHFIDEFSFGGPPDSPQCAILLQSTINTCHFIRAPVAHEKTRLPSTFLTFLRILLDSVHQTLSVPPGEQDEIMAVLLQWRRQAIYNKPCIEWLEFIPIFLALHTWRLRFFRKKIKFHCDNQGVVQAWDGLGSCNAAVLDVMGRNVSVCASGDFVITIKHIAECSNEIVDALPQFQMHRFQSLTPAAHRQLDPIPTVLHNFLTP